MTSREKVAALRQSMKKQGLAAYLVPSADPHLSEYVPDCWKRRGWLTGFSGSAGTALVTLKEAGLWTDSRYFLRAERQLDPEAVRLFKAGTEGTPTVEAYLKANLRRGQACGVDPQTFSQAEAVRLETALAAKGVRLLFPRRNLIDEIWADRPGAPCGPAFLHPARLAGESAEAKLERVRAEMAAAGLDAMLFSALDAIAWLFNLRGSDVEFIPLLISYAIVTEKQATLFVDEAKLRPATRRALEAFLDIAPYGEVAGALTRLGRAHARVGLDPDATTRWAVERLRGAKIAWAPCPVLRAKAIKNETQLKGMRAAHVRDGVACVRFLQWLEGALKRKKWTESALADKADALRAEEKDARGISFETIVAFNPNAASPHYQPRPGKGLPIRKRGILLLDTGGQYLDGTTDITRTITLGKPTARERELFTLVLKAHIGLARASFPKGQSGHQLEALARQPLWQAGLNYGHGTGHGIGCYLSVHEGPIGFSQRGTVTLEPGHVLSLEPGYYEAGKYGFRTENIVVVLRDEERSKPGEEWLRLESLTLCPIDLALVERRMLMAEEIAWLNAYHERVRGTLGPRLKPPARKWLEAATRAI
jgi:Xaa-Pro aminopeptidase